MMRPYSSNFRPLAALLARLPGILFAAFGMAASGHAATGLEGLSDKELREARWYQVELIVFAHANPAASEHWTTVAGVKLPPTLIELGASSGTTPRPAKAATPATRLPALPAAFEPLADKDLQLKDVLARLQSSRQHEPLAHVGWRQPTFERDISQPVLLYDDMGTSLPEPAGADDAATGAFNPRMIGTVELSVARFLHLKTNLVYRTMTPQHQIERVPDSLLWFDNTYPTLRPLQGPAYELRSWQALRGHEMTESRRIRSGEMHYFDHPFFGVVALITPIDIAKETTKEPAKEPAKETPKPPAQR